MKKGRPTIVVVRGALASQSSPGPCRPRGPSRGGRPCWTLAQAPLALNVQASSGVSPHSGCHDSTVHAVGVQAQRGQAPCPVSPAAKRDWAQGSVQ